MPNERLVEIFKCLADPARLRMIGLMVEEPRCGQELASELKLAPATISPGPPETAVPGTSLAPAIDVADVVLVLRAAVGLTVFVPSR